ncbi:MAG: hypothetical protein BWX96_00570 [Bacteroidetes bacterium ADurb.Bin145]|nr:MAG: hypothetical protein BWX96_00570 [Bacteroidetes bacterium ADurb.Bin145]
MFTLIKNIYYSPNVDLSLFKIIDDLRTHTYPLI